MLSPKEGRKGENIAKQTNSKMLDLNLFNVIIKYKYSNYVH